MPEESTTPDLEEALRRSLDAVGRGDFDAAVAPFRPDAVWDMSSTGMGVFEGRDAIRGFFEDVRGSYEDYETSVEEFRDLGNGVAFNVVVARARLLGSAGRVELRYANLGISRDGLIERNTVYTDVDEARATAERLAQERGG